MTTFNWLQLSAGYCGQQDFVTPSTTTSDFRIFPVSVDGVPASGRQSEDMVRKTGQFGAMAAPLPGGRDGATFTVRLPFLLGLLTYDETTATWNTGDQASPAMNLIASALGSKNGSVSSTSDFLQGLNMWIEAYAAAGVASAAADNVVTVKSPTPGGGAFSPGQFFACTDGTEITGGFIKSISSNTLTLAEDAARRAVTDDDIIPTWTIALTSAEQIAMTWRFWGIDAAQLIQLVGCMATAIRIMGAPGKTPEVEIDYIATDYQWLDSGGGLQFPSDLWEYCAPVTGYSGARTTINGTQTCGLEEWMLTIECVLAERMCASGLQGVSQRETVNRIATITFMIPEDTDRAPANGDSYWEDQFTGAANFQLGFEVLTTPGKCLAFLMPAGRLAVPPAPQERNNAIYWQLTMRAGAYNGDGGSTLPADTVLRIGGA
jgi:hypothetical protein